MSQIENEEGGVSTFHFSGTEIRLSKGDAARYSKLQMKGFLAALDEWARRMVADGYKVRSEPEQGPGTMVWRAVIFARHS